MLQFIAQSFSIVLPIFIAGVVFITLLKTNTLDFLDTPIDLKKRFRNKRIFGDNKSWRGVVVYVLLSIAASYVLGKLALTYPHAIHPIFLQNAVIVGLGFSLSYVAGELINSFVKRQMDISPGSSTNSGIQKIIDNIDGMLVVALVLLLVFGVTLLTIAAALIIGYILHKLTDNVMKRIGLKQ